MRLAAGLLALILSAPLVAAEPVRFKDCACGPACGCQLGNCPDKCPKPKADPKASTCMVFVGGQGGTGTCVASAGGVSLILTNAHVVEDCHANAVITVHNHAGGQWKTYRCRYVAGSRVVHPGPNEVDILGPDLALVATQDGEIPAAEVATELPAVGTIVHQFGFGGQYGRPVPFDPIRKTGAVAYHRDRGERSETGCTFRSQSGDSGSGVFDDKGRLVAVTSGLDGPEAKPQSMNRAVRLDVIRAFLAKHAAGAKKAEQPAAEPPAYADAYAKAVGENKPLVVFVACPNVRPIPGAVVAKGDVPYPLPPGTGVLVLRPDGKGRMVCVATLKGCASDAVIVGCLSPAR